LLEAVIITAFRTFYQNNLSQSYQHHHNAPAPCQALHIPEDSLPEPYQISEHSSQGWQHQTKILLHFKLLSSVHFSPAF